MELYNFDKEFANLTLAEAVFQALGAASMCWEHVDKAGVFQSERAKAIGDALLNKIALDTLLVEEKKSNTTCPHTGMPVDICLCMIHDPDGAHFRATRPGMQK